MLLDGGGLILAPRPGSKLARVLWPADTVFSRSDEVRHRVALGRDLRPVRGAGDDDPVLRSGEVAVGPDLPEVADGQVHAVLDLRRSRQERSRVESVLDLEALVLVLHQQRVGREVGVRGAPRERGAVDGGLVGRWVVHEPQAVLVAGVDAHEVLLGLFVDAEAVDHGLQHGPAEFFHLPVEALCPSTETGQSMLIDPKIIVDQLAITSSIVMLLFTLSVDGRGKGILRVTLKSKAFLAFAANSPDMLLSSSSV